MRFGGNLVDSFLLDMSLYDYNFYGANSSLIEVLWLVVTDVILSDTMIISK